MGVSEIMEAGQRNEESKEPDVKRSLKRDIARWEKEQKNTRKGTTWTWKCSVQVMKGFFTYIYLTAVQDSRLV